MHICPFFWKSATEGTEKLEGLMRQGCRQRMEESHHARGAHSKNAFDLFRGFRVFRGAFDPGIPRPATTLVFVPKTTPAAIFAQHVLKVFYGDIKNH
ncbi:MAG: hypothetical protein GF418_02155 [Chitinivibrionales bacterium]|nr:hypothetical protein [Chitinivibrionales bacterium]